MSMYDLMNAGAKIEIKPFREDTKACTPSTFWIDNGTVWASNKHIGTFPRDFSEDDFNYHIQHMIEDGFQIAIHC